MHTAPNDLDFIMVVMTDRWVGGGTSSSKSSGPQDIFSMADMFIADHIDGRSTSSGKATPPVSMIQRQKISYHCQFGDSGEGDGQFTEPSGVAVSMITGDILVADANNHRVQVSLGIFMYHFVQGYRGLMKLGSRKLQITTGSSKFLTKEIISAVSALEIFLSMRYINLHFTYLLVLNFTHDSPAIHF